MSRSRYLGVCAGCGAGRNNRVWGSAKKKKYVSPGHNVNKCSWLDKENLKFYSGVNSRICVSCYTHEKNRYESLSVTQNRAPLGEITFSTPSPNSSKLDILFPTPLPKANHPRPTNDQIDANKSAAHRTRKKACLVHIQPKDPKTGVLIELGDWIELLRLRKCGGIKNEHWAGTHRDSNERLVHCDGSLINALEPVRTGYYAWTYLRCTKCFDSYCFTTKVDPKVDLRL